MVDEVGSEESGVFRVFVEGGGNESMVEWVG